MGTCDYCEAEAITDGPAPAHNPWSQFCGRRLDGEPYRDGERCPTCQPDPDALAAARLDGAKRVLAAVGEHLPWPTEDGLLACSCGKWRDDQFSEDAQSWHAHLTAAVAAIEEGTVDG